MGSNAGLQGSDRASSDARPRKVLLLALGDDFWTPFVVSMGELLAAQGIPFVVVVDSRAGEYQSFGGRIADRLGKTWYFTDFLQQRRDAPAGTPAIPVRAMFPDYFRLSALGARRQLERVEWRGLARSMAAFFEEIFTLENIGVVVHDQVSTSFSYVCHETAAARGIPYLGLVGARIPGRYEIRESIYHEDEVVDGIYRSILDGTAPLSAEEAEWVDAYFADFDATEPSYMKGNALNDARWHRHVNHHKLRSFLRKCWYEIREHAEVAHFTFRDPPVRASIRSLTRNLFRLHHKRQFQTFVTPLDDAWMRSNPFVIFPIHYQPEASTSVGSPHFVNQADVIRNIAFSLPPDLQLVVKEHRSAIGFNSASFYRDVAALPGVLLVDPDLRIKHLIRQSQGVIALTSTAAFEALLLHRRVWLFGATSFQRHPLCRPIASFAELSDALAHRSEANEPYDNRAFAVAYHRYTRPGSIVYAKPRWGIGDDLLQVIRRRLADHNNTRLGAGHQ